MTYDEFEDVGEFLISKMKLWDPKDAKLMSNDDLTTFRLGLMKWCKEGSWSEDWKKFNER